MQALFSIVILVREGRHLLPLTLDTLKAQTEKNFEVVLVDGEGDSQDLSHRYPELVFQVQNAKAESLSEMMNEGARIAKGKYLQFLYPGDRFISHSGLAHLSELICENGEPHLIYFGFLMRGPDALPQAMSYPLTLETLQKGTGSRTSWFLKKTLLDLGGFDRRLSYRSTFDLLCRFFQKQGLKTIYSRRVLTDCEPHRRAPKEVIHYVFETCRILYRHFGLWSAFKWIFVQDQLQFFRTSWRLLKEAFWKGD